MTALEQWRAALAAGTRARTTFDELWRAAAADAARAEFAALVSCTSCRLAPGRWCGDKWRCVDCAPTDDRRRRTPAVQATWEFALEVVAEQELLT